jgi:formamidopyrimidine-DNA glycosylase
MPELPEVETIARQLREGRTDRASGLAIPPLVGRTILETHVHWAREVSGMAARTFERRTRGRCVSAAGRHGKYLILTFTPASGASVVGAPATSAPVDGSAPAFMLVHLRMSGRLEVVPQAEAETKHTRVVWLLDEGWALRFDDARKFGRVYLVDAPERVTGKIGPDALQMTAPEFASRLRQKRGALKPILLDQRFIAGVGNIYSDEALFLAGLHPLRQARTLTDENARQLHAAIRRVLLSGIAANGASFDWVYPGGDYQNSFRVYGRAGEPCVRCGRPITRTVVGQRGTHLCEHCQT